MLGALMCTGSGTVIFDTSTAIMIFYDWIPNFTGAAQRRKTFLLIHTLLQRFYIFYVCFTFFYVCKNVKAQNSLTVNLRKM